MKIFIFFLLVTLNFSTQIEFSKSFIITKFKDYKYVEILSQDQSRVLQSFVLGKNSAKTAEQHKNSPFIEVPIQSFASLSTTHLFQLKQLKEISKIKGVGFYQYLSDLEMKTQLKKDQVVEMGMPGQMNFESVVFARPKVVFSYYVSSDEDTVKKLSEIGVETIYIQEYLESHPLAYAEWIKLFAVFFGKEKEADEIFNQVKKRYLRLANIVSQTKDRPSVLVNENYGGTWYVPNSETFMAKLIEDAGGNYLFSDLNGRGSSKLSIETVIQRGLNADFWINPGQASSLGDLIENDSRYALFEAFQKK
ncbi:ABC transporter substrate-binding protein, partial [bacterium]|nr:ABC transporter substrate-binding protein [bacterium]